MSCKSCKNILIGDDLKFKNCFICRKNINDAKKLDQFENPEKYERRLLSMRTNISKRRKDPAFQKQELDYQINYCIKRGISLNELRGEIFPNNLIE